MKKLMIVFGCLMLVLVFSSHVMAGKGGVKGSNNDEDCATIQSGTLLTSTGDVIVPGYDQWGYNYQARLFNGTYCDSYRDADWCQPWRDVELMMKWNEAWLSNKDCDGDGLLDRHAGFDSYIGSGAWLTNHESGTYTDVDSGDECRWNSFIKIVAAPSDAHNDGVTWFDASGTEIGPVIWGAFAIVQQIDNDPCAGSHGVGYVSPVGPGFGKFK
jgi:hypothetical protein